MISEKQEGWIFLAARSGVLHTIYWIDRATKKAHLTYGYIAEIAIGIEI